MEKERKPKSDKELGGTKEPESKSNDLFDEYLECYDQTRERLQMVLEKYGQQIPVRHTYERDDEIVEQETMLGSFHRMDISVPGIDSVEFGKPELFVLILAEDDGDERAYRVIVTFETPDDGTIEPLADNPLEEDRQENNMEDTEQINQPLTLDKTIEYYIASGGEVHIDHATYHMDADQEKVTLYYNYEVALKEPDDEGYFTDDGQTRLAISITRDVYEITGDLNDLTKQDLLVL